MRYSVLLTLALTACFDITPGRDRDGDGHENLELGGTDCDDENAFVNPDQSEACGNGIDDDCDGFIDDAGVGEVTWYNDDDGDGYPNPVAQVGCAPPASSFADLSRGVDCNDRDATVHPGARELWYDGIDQACDGGDDFDADADGYLPIAHGGDDCDDANNEVNPGSIELCGNGLDDDCDGTPNHCELRGEFDMDEVAASIIEVRARDASFGDVTGDGLQDLLISTWVVPTQSYRLSVYQAVADPQQPLSETPLWSIEGVELEEDVLPPADIDCDGIRDTLVKVDGAIVGFLSPLTQNSPASLESAPFTLAVGERSWSSGWFSSEADVMRLDHPDTACDDLLISVGYNVAGIPIQSQGAIHFIRGPLLDSPDLSDESIVSRPAAHRWPRVHDYGTVGLTTHRVSNGEATTQTRVRGFRYFGDSSTRTVSFDDPSADLHLPPQVYNLWTRNFYIGPVFPDNPQSSAWWLSSDALPRNTPGPDDAHPKAWFLEQSDSGWRLSEPSSVPRGPARVFHDSDELCDVNHDGHPDYIWNPNEQFTLDNPDEVQDTRLEIFYGPNLANIGSREPDAIDYLDEPDNEVRLVACSPNNQLLVGTELRTYFLPPFGL